MRMPSSTIDEKRVMILRRALAQLGRSGDGVHVEPPAELKPLRVDVVVAGLPQTVALEPGELIGGYLALMHILLAAHRSAGRRIVAGLAGVPGSGKSTLAAVLAALWHQIRPGPVLVVVGMDGWHLTNAGLDRRRFVNDDGTSVPLRDRKGSPPSFDVVGLADALRRIRDARDDVPIPRYDRKLHEPVPDAGVVPAATDVVLIEGNYLLNDEGPWADVSGRINLSLWLDVDPTACREGLIARHMAGGMSADQARTKYEQNDWPNTQLALAGRDRAAWLIHPDPSHVIVDVRRSSHECRSDVRPSDGPAR